MATISLALPVSAGTAPGNDARVKESYVIWREVDLAAAVTAKGSALAAADVIEALRIPADSYVENVWAQKITAMTGTSTDLTFDIGVTGGDVDQWVDGWDFDGAAVGAYAPLSATKSDLVISTSDTIDILFATQTGTVLTGKLVVGATVTDISNVPAKGAIAQPKS